MRIDEIKIKNFKAFKDEEVFKFKGKNVLIYGNNGSGKSSVFWALYTFLQSSVKNNDGIKKYFKYFDNDDEQTHQSLLNIFENEGEGAYIEIKIKNDDGPDKIFKISHNDITTNGADKTVQLFNLSSDFINYKLLHNFYSVSHKNEVNLWSVFERDIFPFLMDTVGTTPMLDRIKKITKDVPRTPRKYPVSNGSRRKNDYLDKLNNLNTEIEGLLYQIQENANDFIKKHFFDKKDVIKIELEFKKKFDFNLVKQKIWGKDAFRNSELQIKLIVKVFEENTGDWRPVHRVQSFLNEAQLTRIAIGVRIGALRTRPQTTKAKILVLDDMLISLDMSNRMKVIKMVLNRKNEPGLKFFDEFQKIILTHDKGFYNVIRNYTTSNDWEYYKFSKDEADNTPPKIVIDKDYLERAKSFLEDGEFEICGNELRKEAESILTKYLNPGLNELNGEFQALSAKIKSAYEKLTVDQRRSFERLFVNKQLPVEKLKKIEGDYESDGTLSPGEKRSLGIIKRELFKYLYKQYEVQEEKEKILNETRDILDRVMNPASHASETPLYEGELREAIEGIHRLKTFLEANSN